MRNIPIAKPVIGEAEKTAVMRVLDSGYLVQGDEVAAFEKEFSAYCGAAHGIATTNGTTALTVALMAAGIEPDDEVIIPSFSFVATATSVLGARAKPVFVDIEPESFCIDPAKADAAISSQTKAIMPVHLYGQIAEMGEIQALAEKYDLAIIEDAAQAHGAECNGKRAGWWGPACFSFYPSKNITTGEGGMVVTNDEQLAAKMRMIRNHGMNTRYYHETIGFNFRMMNLCAAIGREQLKHLEAWNKRRIQNAAYFDQHLETVRPPIVRGGCRHIYHQYTVLTPNGADRDAMVKQLNENGVGARIYYPLPIHKQPVFESMGYANIHLPVTEAMARRVFSLPVHPHLSDEDLAYIVEQVNRL